MSQDITELNNKRAEIIKKEQEDEDDILSDVKNLFIQEDEEEEGMKPVVVIEPERVKPVVKPVEVPVSQAEVPPSKQTEARVIFDSSKSKEPIEKTTKQQPAPKQQQSKCKSNSDCETDSYCSLKSGKCLAKLQIGQSGCTSNDQCANDTAAVCLGKKCAQACRDDSDCTSDKTFKCSILKDSDILKGLADSYKGVCKLGDKRSTTEGDSTVKSSSTSSTSPSVALISTVSVVSILSLIVVLIYLRGRLRRRNRNTNPDMFLFDKLQRSASQQSGMIGSTGSVVLNDQLNAKLSGVGGARFTRWAVLTEE